MIARALELIRNKSLLNNHFKTSCRSRGKPWILPGDMREKMDPFIASSLDIFDKLIGKVNRLKLIGCLRSTTISVYQR
jgi:hypothetical protein